MSEEAQVRESPVVIKIRQGLETWLNKADWSYDDLRRWLKGYELPAVGYDQEPYSWILYSLPASEYYYQEMAKRIAQFLQQEKPYQNLSSDYDDTFFYNLFHLSAGLGCKRELGKPLTEIFTYFANSEGAWEKFFDNRKRYNLNNAFREALITNQTDLTLSDIWKEGLDGKQSSFLMGDIYSYFRGILYLSNNDQPMTEEIGRALKKMAEYLDTEKNRHDKFRLLLRRVEEVWPHERFSLDWDEILFNQAMKNTWPDWAVVELKTLVLPIRTNTGEMKRYFIWEIYLPFLEELKIVFKLISRTGILLEIEASREAVMFLEKTSPTVEQIRLRSPFRNYKSVLGVANQGFMDLELYFYLNREFVLASAIGEGRRKILNRLGFPYEHDTTKNIYESTPDANLGSLPEDTTQNLYESTLDTSLGSLLEDFTPQPFIFIGLPHTRQTQPNP